MWLSWCNGRFAQDNHFRCVRSWKICWVTCVLMFSSVVPMLFRAFHSLSVMYMHVQLVPFQFRHLFTVSRIWSENVSCYNHSRNRCWHCLRPWKTSFCAWFWAQWYPFPGSICQCIQGNVSRNPSKSEEDDVLFCMYYFLSGEGIAWLSLCQ